MRLAKGWYPEGGGRMRTGRAKGRFTISSQPDFSETSVLIQAKAVTIQLQLGEGSEVPFPKDHFLMNRKREGSNFDDTQRRFRLPLFFHVFSTFFSRFFHGFSRFPNRRQELSHFTKKNEKRPKKTTLWKVHENIFTEIFIEFFNEIFKLKVSLESIGPLDH